MSDVNMVALGARVPEDLKNNITQYCRERGIKMQFFVVQALKDKFLELQEDAQDEKIVSERMKRPDLAGMDEFEAYLADRKKAL